MVKREGLLTTMCQYFLMACCNFGVCKVRGKHPEVKGWNCLPVEPMEIFKQHLSVTCDMIQP